MIYTFTLNTAVDRIIYFDEELENYCKMDVEILKLAMCKYMAISLDLSGWNPVVNTSTYAGFSMFQV